MKDELHALKQLKNDEDIVILFPDKGLVTVVMDKKHYTEKNGLTSKWQSDMRTTANVTPCTPALQRRLNGKPLELKKTVAIDIQLY